MRIASPPEFLDVVKSVARDQGRLVEVLVRSPALPPDQYLHWDELQYASPPEGLNRLEWWFLIKVSRQVSSRQIPHKDKNGRPFMYAEPDLVRRALHEFDIKMRRRDDGIGRHHLINSLMEEAITSSQLEGAPTTRAQARELLKQEAKPRDIGERMIFNGYVAIEQVRKFKNIDLTPEMVLQIHKTITEKTLPEDEVGVLRQCDDIGVQLRGEVVHHPPNAAELDKRLRSLCEFANLREKDAFLHPIIRAIILHFLLTYDHPFTEGNGRMARALFYWSLLRDGYDAMQYISISRKLKEVREEYSNAHLRTETDEGDITYFIIQQLDVINKALDDTNDYLKRKEKQESLADEVVRKWRIKDALNDRQMALLGRAIRKPNPNFTVKGHQRSHGVTQQTARTDLLVLEQHGLLEKRKQGKAFVYSLSKKFRDRLKRKKKELHA